MYIHPSTKESRANVGWLLCSLAFAHKSDFDPTLMLFSATCHVSAQAYCRHERNVACQSHQVPNFGSKKTPCNNIYVEIIKDGQVETSGYGVGSY